VIELRAGFEARRRDEAVDASADRESPASRHPPITYAAYLDWWYDANYNAARQRDVA